jgi:tRNA(Ile)-lysidine synthase
MHELKPVTHEVSEPLSAEEFAGLMQRLGVLPSHRLAVAVSGGPDSMALAYCLKRWGGTVTALIVDHGLRPESAVEAEQTQKRLAAQAIPATILRWEHEPVVTRLHVTARKARYRLLLDACRHQGIAHLLLAHQREDQAETILMRLAKGSGINGLAGISAHSVSEDIHILRPLLSLAKERLIATCVAAGLLFITDASNASDQFARGRLRKVLPLLEAEGLTIERLIDLGERADSARQALDHTTLQLLSAASTRDEAGTIRIALAPLQAAPMAIVERALAASLHSIHPNDYAPEYASLKDVCGAITSIGDMPSRTLHGCLISKTATHVILVREYAGIIETPLIRAGENLLWDGRWHVTLDTTAGTEPFTIRPLGNPPHETLDILAPGLRQRLSQGRARAALPSLWRGNDLCFIPSIDARQNIASARLLSAWPILSTGSV